MHRGGPQERPVFLGEKSWRGAPKALRDPGGRRVVKEATRRTRAGGQGRRDARVVAHPVDLQVCTPRVPFIFGSGSSRHEAASTSRRVFWRYRLPHSSAVAHRVPSPTGYGADRRVLRRLPLLFTTRYQRAGPANDARNVVGKGSRLLEATRRAMGFASLTRGTVLL